MTRLKSPSVEYQPAPKQLKPSALDVFEWMSLSDLSFLKLGHLSDIYYIYKLEEDLKANSRGEQVMTAAAL